MKNFYTKLVLGIFGILVFSALMGTLAKHNGTTYRQQVHQAAEDWVRQASIARIDDPTLHIWCQTELCQVFYRPPMEHDVSRISLRCTTRVCVEVK